MVIYLEEAVVRKRQAQGGHLTRDTLLEAVTEGALLRLRPKVPFPLPWLTRGSATETKRFG